MRTDRAESRGHVVLDCSRTSPSHFLPPPLERRHDFGQSSADSKQHQSKNVSGSHRGSSQSETRRSTRYSCVASTSAGSSQNRRSPCAPDPQSCDGCCPRRIDSRAAARGAVNWLVTGPRISSPFAPGPHRPSWPSRRGSSDRPAGSRPGPGSCRRRRDR